MSNDRGVKWIKEGLPSLVWQGVGKEVIKDDLATDDLTLVPAMSACLAHVDERFSKVYLAGTSCAYSIVFTVSGAAVLF